MADPKQDEWTVARPKKNRRTAKKGPKCCSNCFETNIFDKDTTVDSLQKELAKWTKDWHRLGLMKDVKKTIKRLHLDDRPPITRAVCLGLGNLATINLENLGRSMRQLSAFIDITKHLESLTEGTVTMYIQEPRMYDIEKQFFTSIGIEVIEWKDEVKQDMGSKTLGPVEEYLDLQTFVADFFVDRCVTVAFADEEIGLLVSPLPNILDSPDEENEEVDAMAYRLKTSYQFYEFPLKYRCEPYALAGLYICGWKEDEEN